jgi:PAS domain S-box-containing protein
MDSAVLVLLLEDDPVTAELERRALTRAGFTVRSTATVGDALSLLREARFAVVISDYHLPDGEPWPLIHAANQQIPRVPVILVTAMGSEKIAAEALHSGVHEYVRKADGFWSELPAAVQRVVRVAAAQRTMQMSDKLFQLIAGSLSDIIIAGNLHGEITYISPACHPILGYEPLELKSLLNINLVHPDDRELMTTALKNTRLQGQTTATFRCRTRAGEYRWIESNLNSLCQSSAEIPELIAISRDVTERKNAEIEITKLNDTLNGRLAELQRAGEALVAARERAEEANRAKSDFLAAMSHEIRTPMNAILGMSDLLRETELDTLQGEYVDRCRRAGASLLTLINDILDLSKIESGRFTLEQIPFDLEDLVEGTLEMMAPRAHMKDVGLFARIAPDTPLSLLGDPTRLQQVMINLLGNAVKFTQRGEIVMNVAPERVSDVAHLRFDVSDTGIGIPAAKLDAIFEDFTQADSSTTRRFGGTGLGLGIARRLVECMGGRLTVSSVLDQGSTFRFDAIFAIDPAPVAVPLPKDAQELIGQRVLIVDDSQTNRMILSRMCLGWRMIPTEAGSAEEARSAVESANRTGRPFALAILDVLMPKVGGFDTLSQIREIDLQLPVIMITSNNQPGDATKARALGASAFATKPIRRSELIRLITGAIAPTNESSPAPSPGSSSSAASGQPAGRKMDILVAEDSEDNRFLLKAYLTHRKYDLKFVENGLDAVNTFQERKFDLVLMDVLMPVMDGLTATKLIRSFEQENNRAPTPILALTANALLGHSDESRVAGCDLHLSKPISKEQLVAAVDNFLHPL